MKRNIFRRDGDDEVTEADLYDNVLLDREFSALFIRFLNEFGPCMTEHSRVKRGMVSKEHAVTRLLTNADLSYLILTYMDRFDINKEQIENSDDKGHPSHKKVNSKYCIRKDRKMRNTGYTPAALKMYHQGIKLFKDIRTQRPREWERFEERCVEDFKKTRLYKREVQVMNAKKEKNKTRSYKMMPVEEADIPELPPIDVEEDEYAVSDVDEDEDEENVEEQSVDNQGRMFRV